MKIIVDENIPKITINELRLRYPDIKDVRGTSNEGIDDDTLWELAQSERRLLITTDKGFSKYRYQQHHGIIIILLKQPTLMKIHQRAITGIEEFSEEEWKNRILTVKDTVKSIWYPQNL